ncbi:polygalacturonase-like [Durio zibethinus]|uniref:Polygalacturonase n=1 Tax=Durio zibethinus TaxID=66656 RepID=A0A6P5XKM5_DURZI|nr:polygalacturonase-like [Durio zibethinus]
MGVQWNMAIIPILFLFLFTSTAKAQSGVFDLVAKYGAKADGKTDLSQPLLNAWKEACASTTPSKIVIPKGTYFLSKATLEGPCKGPIELQVQGTVMAPADPSVFKQPDWVAFNRIDQFSMSGGGVFDGQGATAWGKNDCAKHKYCTALPVNLRFNFVNNAMIQDITTKDSKQFHVNVLGCKNITFLHFTVSAPENSINTDGIHIGRSDGVNITNAIIKTGDDCVSLGDGSKNVVVHGVTCGPGHGISIGSLGKFQGEEPVAGVHVSNCTISNTMNGVRIKSWPASYPGSATDMHFQDITMNNVGNPIIVDQEYCPWNQCNLKLPSRIKLSNISFKNIRGTSSTQQAVKLICSSSLPCEGVELANIDLVYNGPEGPATCHCQNVSPKLTGKQNPSTCSTPSQ